MNLFKHIATFKKFAQYDLNKVQIDKDLMNQRDFDLLHERLMDKINEILTNSEKAGNQITPRYRSYKNALNVLNMAKMNGDMATYGNTLKNLKNTWRREDPSMESFYEYMEPFFTKSEMSSNKMPSKMSPALQKTIENADGTGIKFKPDFNPSEPEIEGHEKINVQVSANKFKDTKTKFLDQVEAAIELEQNKTIERKDQSSYARNLKVLNTLKNNLENLPGVKLMDYFEKDAGLNSLLKDRDFQEFREPIFSMLKSVKEVVSGMKQ